MFNFLFPCQEKLDRAFESQKRKLRLAAKAVDRHADACDDLRTAISGVNQRRAAR